MDLPLYVLRQTSKEIPHFNFEVENFRAGERLEKNQQLTSSQASTVKSVVAYYDGEVDNIRVAQRRIFLFRSRTRQTCGLIQMSEHCNMRRGVRVIPLPPSKGTTWVRAAIISLFEHEVSCFQNILTATMRGNVTIGEYLHAVHQCLNFEAPQSLFVYKTPHVKAISVFTVYSDRSSAQKMLDPLGNDVEQIVTDALPLKTMAFPLFRASIEESDVGTRERLAAMRVIDAATAGE